jgi:hypothetical protein
MAIPLGRMSPPASCDRPGQQLENPLFATENRAKGRPYLVLLQVGFALPPPLPAARCALTAPFHPYRRKSTGGIFSVALSLGSPPPGATRHLVSVEPGLSSIRAEAQIAAIRPSGAEAKWASCVGRSSGVRAVRDGSDEATGFEVQGAVNDGRAVVALEGADYIGRGSLGVENISPQIRR